MAAFNGIRNRLASREISRRWNSSATFSGVTKSLPDPMQELKVLTDNDHAPNKMDLGAGVYRDEHGQYHEFEVIKKAKKRLETMNPGHDVSSPFRIERASFSSSEYNLTVGIPTFRRASQEILFGKESAAVAEKRIATIQTVVGTGANRTGAAFLKRNFFRSDGTSSRVYVAEPAWPNYRPLSENAGFEVESYNHLTKDCGQIDIDVAVESLQSAPRGSIFALQACCHNPTGLNYSKEQWKQLAEIMFAKNHFAFFDAAYIGFGPSKPNALEDDAWGLRHFLERGVDMLACQSFSKIFGLYSERVGALHVVCATPAITENVLLQLRAQIRWEVSSAPAWGARLVDIILQDESLSSEWRTELSQAATRIEKNRHNLHRQLTEDLRTPGPWDRIVKEKGQFSFTSFNESQIETLRKQHHIFLLPNGRINVAGLSKANTRRAAESIDSVVRG